MSIECLFCDGCGGKKTYRNQICLPINNKVVCVDFCIHQIVAALNAGGVETVASCCGHRKRDGSIMFKDGRELIVKNNQTARDE